MSLTFSTFGSIILIFDLMVLVLLLTWISVSHCCCWIVCWGLCSPVDFVLVSMVQGPQIA